MKFLILTSGGDAPGMNACVHYVTKYLTAFKKNEVVASLYGFQGLLDNNIINLTPSLTKKHKDLAGSFIKSSRCLEFKREKGFNKALETLKQNKIDVVIILGGDGSYKGSTSLKNAGINVLFIPATIDKDLPYQTYSIGFDTAGYACKTYIDNVRLTMRAFDRICIYEIMGRDNSSLTNYVKSISKADFAITNETINKIDFEKVRQSYKNNPSLTILLQERLLPIEKVEDEFAKQTGGGVRSCKIGYVQRGTAPTKQEKENAKLFAKTVSAQSKAHNFNFALSLTDGKTKKNKLA